MAIEQREGILDAISDKGIVLSGARLSYSKWFEGERPTDDLLGSKIQVVVDAGEKCTFLKKIVHIGEKAEGWKPPESHGRGFFGGGGGRRFSPEELEIKRDEGVRIARSVAIDRAIAMVREGVSIEEIAPFAKAVEEYLLKGNLPQGSSKPMAEAPQKSTPEKPPSASPPAHAAPSVTPPQDGATKGTPSSAPAKPKRLASRAVNALFNDALRGGLVDDWSDFLQIVEDVLKVKGKSPYQLDVPAFLRVEAVIRGKLGQEFAA